MSSRLSRRRLLELGGAAALGGLSACIPNGRLKRPLEMAPRDLGDGWEIATPEAVGLDPARVRAAYERVFSEDEFLDTVSCLVVCKGKLVAEGYVRDPADATRKEFVQSVTKSVVSMTFGASWPGAPAWDLDAPISRWLDVRDPAKRALTLRHLLTMRTGIDVDQDTYNIETSMRRRRGLLEWILSSPTFAAPGEVFRYSDSSSHLLAAVIRAATGETVETIARRRMFEPLGIADFDWERDADGDPFGGFGLRLRPRDLAKVGELTLRRGVLRGAELVPSAWLDLATQVHSDTPYSASRGVDYGLHFWVMPGLGFSSWGHGGNFTFVAPSAELVVVLTGTPHAGGDVAPEVWDAGSLARTILGS